MNLQKKPYRVLTIDGGGMRGLYSATVLDTLSRRFAREGGYERLDIGKGFDLIVGTSTGGILACALANGIPTSEIINFYREDGKQIFKDPVPEKWKLWAFRNRKKPANSAEPLRKALKKSFKETTLGSLYEERRIGLCIPTVNVMTQKPWVFKTPHNPKKQRDNGYSLVDVCLATSAAPIIFPLAAIDDPDDDQNHFVFADGGLWANNPVLVGMVEALSMTRQNKRPIEIISLGTCAPPEGRIIQKNQVNWGIGEWKAGINSLSLALDAQAAGYQFIASMLAECLDQKCAVIRLPTSPPSSEQASCLGLDKADNNALKVLTNLGKQDGNYIHGAANRQGDTEILANIFQSMPPYSEDTEN